MNRLVVPYLDNLTTENGTRLNPFILHVTRGQRDNSYVFHFKENRKYYQYHPASVNKSSVNLRCMYSKLKKCPATLTITPNNSDLIQNERCEKTKKYFLATKILNEDSAADWVVKQNTGKGEHTAFCQNQVPLNKRPRMDDAVEELAKTHEIKAYNQQWCRFGPGGALARDFRYTQTRAAII